MAYALTLVAGVCFHEIWRDEAQAWLIVRDARSLPELFRLLGYEGHPALWYLLLYPVAKYATHSPSAIQILHAVIATASVYLFTRLSPFTWLQKLLWCFGYYSLFEYGVISRNYALGALLLWSACAMWPRRREHRVAMAVILAMLANTNLFATLVAVAFAIAWFIDAQWTGKPLHAEGSGGRVGSAIAGVIVSAGLVSCAWTVYPPRDAIIRPMGEHLQAAPTVEGSVRRAAERIGDVWRSYFPIPDPAADEFWNTNILRVENPVATVIGVVLSVTIVIVSLATLRHNRAALLTYAIATTAIIIAMCIRFPFANRHIGHLLLTYIACCWIARGDGAVNAGRHCPDRALLWAIFGVQFAVGAWAMYVDVRRPFSSGDDAARWLRSNGLADAAFVGEVAHRYSPMVARLDTNIYFPVRRAWGSYALLDRTSKDASPHEIAEACRALLNERRPVILIASRPLLSTTADGVRYEAIAKFTGSITRESYHIYRVSPAEPR